MKYHLFIRYDSQDSKVSREAVFLLDAETFQGVGGLRQILDKIFKKVYADIESHKVKDPIIQTEVRQCEVGDVKYSKIFESLNKTAEEISQIIK